MLGLELACGPVALLQWSLEGHGAKGVRFRVFKRIAAQNNGESDGNWHYMVV